MKQGINHEVKATCAPGLSFAVRMIWFMLMSIQLWKNICSCILILQVFQVTAFGNDFRPLFPFVYRATWVCRAGPCSVIARQGEKTWSDCSEWFVNNLMKPFHTISIQLSQYINIKIRHSWFFLKLSPFQWNPQLWSYRVCFTRLYTTTTFPFFTQVSQNSCVAYLTLQTTVSRLEEPLCNAWAQDLACSPAELLGSQTDRLMFDSCMMLYVCWNELRWCNICAYFFC